MEFQFLRDDCMCWTAIFPNMLLGNAVLISGFIYNQANRKFLVGTYAVQGNLGTGRKTDLHHLLSAPILVAEKKEMHVRSDLYGTNHKRLQQMSISCFTPDQHLPMLW